MLLGDPPRSQGDINLVLFGIPVRVTPMFWIVGLLLGLNNPTPLGLLTWMAALFVAILVHEMGHAMMMRSYGFYPWVTLYGMGGLASYNPAQARRSLGTWDHIQISAAGPGAGFLLAAVVLLLVSWTGHNIVREGPFGILFVPAEVVWRPGFTVFIYHLLFICIFWGIINLLPIYPLDGGHISRELFLRFSRADGIRQSLMLSFVTAAMVAMVGFIQWRDFYIAIFFGYFAYASLSTLQAYGRGPW